ncbi:MAG: CfrBI family restriction endonuclease [Candidatus Omnitrophica bacterium]|nr:CfrBI family restriction endonuclease [Candidatus Omnitrophota bacterium]
MLYRSTLGRYVPQAITELIGSRGVDVIKRIGIDEVKRVVADVLCGVNLRDSTELLTRRRIGMLNAATLVFFLRGVAASKRFLQRLPQTAVQGLKGQTSKQERWLLQWVLGLTTKGVQNILRDDHRALDRYQARFVHTQEDIAGRCAREFGPVAGVLRLGGEQGVPLSWDFLLSLFCAIGSQTLAIRGSEKSTYGKLFERLVLGSALNVLGFTYMSYPPRKTHNVFWLSGRLGTRESDATVLCGPGKAIRFDIGFIGRGNPEISKDKVSRFERQFELGDQTYYCATFVVVDRIGERSRIVEQARAINGTIIQMSMSYWPKVLAQALQEKTDYHAALIDVPDSKVESWLRKEMDKVTLEQFVEATSTLIAEEKDADEVE